MNKIEELYYDMGHFDTHMILNRKEIDEAIESINNKITALKAQQTKVRSNIKALRKNKKLFIPSLSEKYKHTIELGLCRQPKIKGIKLAFFDWSGHLFPNLSEIKQAIKEGEIK